MAIDLERIRAFVAVVDAGGFQAAARRLNRAQPWLSVQVRQLEETVGYALINRAQGRGISLTAQGSQFLPHAKQAVQAFEEMLEGARDIARAGVARLRIGADPFTLHIPERNILLARFLDQHPEVNVTIRSAEPNELYQQLADDELDLIIATDPDGVKHRADRLCTYTIALLVPDESPWASVGEVGLAALRGEHVLTVHQAYSPRFLSRLHDYCLKAGIELGYAPEPGYGAVMRYAQLQRRPMITVNFSAAFHEIPADMRFCRIAGPPLTVSWHIVGMKTPETRVSRQFRQLGSAIAANPTAAWRR